MVMSVRWRTGRITSRFIVIDRVSETVYEDEVVLLPLERRVGKAAYRSRERRGSNEADYPACSS